jgi:hypothetical protein
MERTLLSAARTDHMSYADELYSVGGCDPACRPFHMYGRVAVGLTEVPLCRVQEGGSSKLSKHFAHDSVSADVASLLDRFAARPQVRVRKTADGAGGKSRRMPPWAGAATTVLPEVCALLRCTTIAVSSSPSPSPSPSPSSAAAALLYYPV